jgi:hypothetical protein
MASPLIPILVIVAVGAAVLLGKKKKDTGIEAEPTGPKFEATPTGPDGGPPPDLPFPEGVAGPPPPPPAPFPEQERLATFVAGGYEGAVDQCVAEMGLVEADRIKICALDMIFPEAPWPPPQNAHQWQRNVWHNTEFNDYILSKWPPVS